MGSKVSNLEVMLNLDADGEGWKFPRVGCYLVDGTEVNISRTNHAKGLVKFQTLELGDDKRWVQDLTPVTCN